MKVYLAGPMNGIPEFNVPAFLRAEDYLVSIGNEVLSPARDYLEYQHPGSDPTTSTDTAEAHAAYLRRDVKMLLDVEGICLLDGWETSSGANVELVIARALNLAVYALREMTKGFDMRPTRAIPSNQLMHLMIARADHIMSWQG